LTPILEKGENWERTEPLMLQGISSPSPEKRRELKPTNLKNTLSRGFKPLTNIFGRVVL